MSEKTHIPANEAVTVLLKDLQVKMGGSRRANSPELAQVALRDMEAYRLYICEGKSYREIAEVLGYGSKATVGQAIKRFLRDAVQETAHEMRATAKERLNELMPVYFQKAKEGDLKAAQFVLSLMNFDADAFGYKQQPAQNEQDVERQAQEAAQQRQWAEIQLAGLCRQFSEIEGREVAPEEVIDQLSKQHGDDGAFLAQSIVDALGGNVTQSAAIN